MVFAEVTKTAAKNQCSFDKYCIGQELNIKEPSVIFYILKKDVTDKENNIHHTIKWLGDIYRNVERE